MIRRIVTRLAMAYAIPMGIKAAKKLFRKRKQAQIEPNPQHDNLEASSDEAISDRMAETADVNEADQVIR